MVSAHLDHKDARYENTLAKDFIMDAPWRVIDQNTPIPVTIIIKDCDTDDVRDLHWVRIWDETSGNTILWDHDFNDEEIGDDASEHNYWTYITKVTEGHPSLPNGTALTPSNLGYTTGDHINLKVEIYYRDDWFNYTETRHLRVHVGSGPFPWPSGWYGGDIHYHTMYTNNIYEYGAPLPAVKQTAIAMGLHWLTATDHSCDLDETGDGTYSYATQQWEYTLQDVGGTFTDYRNVASHGSSWGGLGADVADLDCSEFRLYRAVELNMASIDPSSMDKTLHCLVYNDDYIHSPDSGAPGERPVSPTLLSGLDQITGNGFAYSAHPLSDLSGEFLGFDFGTNGSVWGMTDITQALTRESFRGLQIFNTRSTVTSLNQNNPWSDFDGGNAIDNPYPNELLGGIALWDDFIATDIASGSPRKLFLAGGSDAHGDFNYSTHMSLDDFAEDNAIGKVQTVAFVPGAWSPGNLPPVESLLAAYRAGQTVATDGPFLEIGIDVDDDGSWYGENDLMIGDDGSLPLATNALLHLRWASLVEFGPVNLVRLIAIDAVGPAEILSFSPGAQFEGTNSTTLSDHGLVGWVALRAELLTADGGVGHRAYTNPIWVFFDETSDVGHNTLPVHPTRLLNVPNPFNPQTEIRFELTRAAAVTLEVFNARGELVRTLISSQQFDAGDHASAWDGCDARGHALASGVYSYRLISSDGVQQGKMSLIR
jgi:hypothetical protein